MAKNNQKRMKAERNLRRAMEIKAKVEANKKRRKDREKAMREKARQSHRNDKVREID